MVLPPACSHADAAGDRSEPGSLSPLVHSTSVGAGVEIGVDLMAPWRWHATPDPAADDETGPPLCLGTTDPACPTSGAWLRVAFVEAVHRWSILPLDQSLVDAERGVSRWRAATTLPDVPARGEIVGEAVRLARRASAGFAGFLASLADRSTPAPEPLLAALKRLAKGYAALAAEVRGPDEELGAVVDGWRELLGHDGKGRRSSPPEVRRPLPHSGGSHLIDPRQIRARILALSADPAAAEIAVSEVPGDAVHIEVPAFGPEIDLDVAARLTVRLVDRRTGNAKGHALLRWTDVTPAFEATVSLCGLEVADVRADVFDALSDVPPAADDDEALQDARRAVVFHAEWRHLTCLAHLLHVPGEPERRVRALATRIRPDGATAGSRMFAGGPSFAELESLADLGSLRLLDELRRAPGPGLFALSGDAAGLLTAELAAVFLGPRD
jgi:hypothetical protein